MLGTSRGRINLLRAGMGRKGSFLPLSFGMDGVPIEENNFDSFCGPFSLKKE